MLSEQCAMRKMKNGASITALFVCKCEWLKKGGGDLYLFLLLDENKMQSIIQNL